MRISSIRIVNHDLFYINRLLLGLSALEIVLETTKTPTAIVIFMRVSML